MLRAEIAPPSAAVPGTPARLAKVEQLAACLGRLPPAEVPVAVAHLWGELPRGAVGVGWASLRGMPPPAEPPGTVELLEADAALTRVQAATGTGSQGRRRSELAGLFARLTDPEQRFVTGLLSGELRQGALGGVMVEAVARAAAVPVADLRRALLVSGDLPSVAAAALEAGGEGLAPFPLPPFPPPPPVPAQTAPRPQGAPHAHCPARGGLKVR